MPQGFLTDQHINIAGHKVPFALIGAGAAAIGLLVVLRARSRGGNVAASGTQPATPADSSAYSPFASVADLSSGLAGIRQDIASGALAGPAPTVSVPTPPALDTSGATGPSSVPITAPLPVTAPVPPPVSSPVQSFTLNGGLNAFDYAQTPSPEPVSAILGPGTSFTLLQSGIFGNKPDTGAPSVYDLVSVPGKGNFYVLDTALQNSGFRSVAPTPPPAPATAPAPLVPRIGAGFHPQIR